MLLTLVDEKVKYEMPNNPHSSSIHKKMYYKNFMTVNPTNPQVNSITRWPCLQPTQVQVKEGSIITEIN